MGSALDVFDYQGTSFECAESLDVDERQFSKQVRQTEVYKSPSMNCNIILMPHQGTNTRPYCIA